MAAVQPAGPEPMMTTFSTDIPLAPFQGCRSFPQPSPLYHARCIPIVGRPTGRSTPSRAAPETRPLMLRLTDLREILRYVPRFRDRVFVIALDGAIVEDDNFRNLLLDIALLRSLSIRVVLIHGAAH